MMQRKITRLTQASDGGLIVSLECGHHHFYSTVNFGDVDATVHNGALADCDECGKHEHDHDQVAYPPPPEGPAAREVRIFGDSMQRAAEGVQHSFEQPEGSMGVEVLTRIVRMLEPFKQHERSRLLRAVQAYFTSGD